MKACLAIAPSWYRHSPPLGLGLIKSYVEARGHSAVVRDIGAAQSAAPGRGLDREADALLATGARVFGFSLYSTNWDWTLGLARRIKRRDASRLVVWGGPECVRREATFRDDPALRGLVDAWVPGEGEGAFAGLLDGCATSFAPTPGAWVRRGSDWADGGPARPLERLDDLPAPDFSDLDLALYREPRELPVYFSRGCFKKCTFCDVEFYWGRWRNRSGRRVYEEAARLVARHPGVDRLLFCDSILNADVKALEEFCDLALEGRRRGEFPAARWQGYAVVRGDMTPALLGKMRAAGCDDLMIGIESGSPAVLAAMKKQYRIETAERMLADARRSGIFTSVLLMVGFPTETEEDFALTLDFLRRNAASIGSVNPSEAFTYVDQGTYLAEHAFDEYGVDPGTFHPDFWRSQGGANDYPARLERFERLCAAAASFGIRVGDAERRVRAQKETRLASYRRFLAGLETAHAA